jgi:hypothetical protein
MKHSRWASLVVSAAVLLSYVASAKADTIEVQFSGTIFVSDTPGITSGESFSGGFTYSTTDTFEGSSNGLNSFNLTDPEDNLFVSIGGSTVSLGQPVSGVTALIGLAPLSFDSDPNQDYFAVESDSSSGTVSTSFDIPGVHFDGLSTQLIGNTNFLSSGALPDPFDTSDVIFGLDTNGLSSSITLNFADANNDVLFTVGEITDVSAVTESAVPEPHGSSLACLAIVALALLVFRRPTGNDDLRDNCPASGGKLVSVPEVC